MGKKGITGKYTVSKEDYDALKNLAKEGVSSRGEIEELKRENNRLRDRIYSLQGQIRRLEAKLDELEDFCRPYLEVMKRFPEKVKAFFENLFKSKEKEQPPEIKTPKRRKEISIDDR